MSFPITTNEVTIANNASLSGATYIGYGRLVGIIIGSDWDAADITLQGSIDGTNFTNLYEPSSDTEYTIQAGASRFIALPVPIQSVPWVKLRSGTSGSPVNQSPATTLTLVVEKVAAQGQ